tara:strand:+ start:2323 stop:2499 length:177 start_codon:yes stop_codon:yes gene_type:complete
MAVHLARHAGAKAICLKASILVACGRPAIWQMADSQLDITRPMTGSYHYHLHGMEESD